MMRFIGCHVSSAGGLANAIRNGSALGVNTIQLHPAPPQRWNSKPFPEGVEEEFLVLRADSEIEKVFFHAIYLINLATPDQQKLHLAKKSLQYFLDLSARIHGDGVIVHVGSMKDQEDENLGYAQIGDAISEILSESPDSSRLLLEVAAGSGKIIGAHFEELQRIFNIVQNPGRLGFALDSQHMWASGYDLQQNLEAIVSEVDDVLGIENVHAIHLNDSKTECGSRKDRHENIGDGLIGLEALTNFLNHPKLRKIPFMLETPALKSMETAKPEVEKLQALVTD